MTKRYEYRTWLFRKERGFPGTFAGFPYDVRQEFGTGGPVRINCWIDGEHKTGSLVPMGQGEHAIHIRQEVLKKIGKQDGDEVSMRVEQDLSPPQLTIPEDFQWLLDNEPELVEKFGQLPLSYKKAIITHIEEAKRAETRVKRIENFIARIKVGFYPGQKL